MTTKTKLTLASFEASLDDYSDNVDDFSKLLPDNFKDVPKTLLIRCAQEKALKCIKALLNRYPDYPVNESTKKDRATALHIAAAGCPQELVRYVITSSEGDDTDGCCRFEGFVYGKIIDELLNAGANGRLRDKSGDIPFDLFQKLRQFSSWEHHLITTPTYMGNRPNQYFEKHTKIKDDLERVKKVLIAASVKNGPSSNKKRKKAEEKNAKSQVKEADVPQENEKKKKAKQDD